MPLQEARVVRFVLPSLPPSINSIYIPEIRGGRFVKMRLTDAARYWKSASKEYVPRFEIMPGALLRIDFIFHYPFLYQNLKMREFDSQNLMKLAIDCICEKLGLRDKLVKAGSWESVDEEREFVEVTLSEVTP